MRYNKMCVCKTDEKNSASLHNAYYVVVLICVSAGRIDALATMQEPINLAIAMRRRWVMTQPGQSP